MKWRKLNKILHRDIGYALVALTIIYSISGIAVNHINDWNPNYIIRKDTITFTPHKEFIPNKEKAINYLVSQLDLGEKIRESFRPDSASVQLFLEDQTIVANLVQGRAIIESVESRSVFRETNFLHLNAPKKLWTYIADIFAFGLIVLAITGLFMLKGKQGFGGRGKWFVLGGILIPIIFLLLYFQ
ncbi:MAG: PepSY-associated TM helix domain-containing protein [Melioribacteraceae bacterium]|nr:PepSY-associated TM helix domain-containing protein [Melioribacteraceae bacterium]MCF8263173.1 PepSY-associated TM helix domain-containing protein [Melioribacteraceae bacterium]MCF8414049.1 PepSY-associated TM helix domain-containing protein [Melioribacteraceae bacterium]MCF8430339.1 PepSY-associated TM helix domain-containing protein [Melioribacteraceae bacterium]